MITDRNKLNFVTIQRLWFLCFILIVFNGCTNIWIQNVEATQQQQTQTQPQPQQEILQQQLKSALKLQQDIEGNGLILQTEKQQQQQQDVTVRNFSPRMDYNNNEWRPVGRGDPLKNDPTFDYSPPTLDRVRYWADPDKDKEKVEEVAAALVDAKLKKANPGKNEILLLGVTGDRIRGGSALHQHQAHNMLKNAKGGTPLLQPKYTSIRRSYYAHQLPTHLMPPPMQPMIPATQQNQLQQNQIQQQQQQQMQSMPIVKPAHTEHRHNMPAHGHSYMTSSPMSLMSGHSKSHYMSAATQPWMHALSSSPISSSSGHSAVMMSSNPHRYSYDTHYKAHDSHHQESANYVAYHNRPSVSSTPSLAMPMSGGSISHHEIYSPNSIKGSSSVHKVNISSRKPWIHDLLQKEFIKPIKPTQSPNSYDIYNVKSSSNMESHFEPILKPQGISTTYAPVTFVTPPTTPSSTTIQTIYITSTSQQQTSSTSPSPKYTTTPMTTLYSTQQAPQTTTTLSPTRLLIPNTSNLAYRPTIAPIKMTTDSLFSHYHQPEKPLRGPMYLIIEGHSKVKTYGKDELDPHKPKIVPIIPKREPVVRIADPNEKRGTPETFQVKHLHTKTTQTMKPTTTTTTTTTKKPEAETITTAMPQTTDKPNTTNKIMASTATTTVKPFTTKPAPKLSVATTTLKPKIEKTLSKDSKLEKPLSQDTKIAKIANPNAIETSEKPSHTVNKEAPISMQAYEPPTGMQGLLSFIDSSLDSFLKEDYVADAKEVTTKLKPIPIKNTNDQLITPDQIEARVSTKLEPVKAADYEEYVDDNYFQFTTEYLPRETRQIFDYDQLPESRINIKSDEKFKDFLGEIEEDDSLSPFNLDDEYDDDEVEEGVNTGENNDNAHNIIKRIDSLVSDSIEETFDDLSSSLDDDEEDLTNRKSFNSQQLKPEITKA